RTMFNWPREGRWKNECCGEGVFNCVLGKLKRRYRRAYHRPPRVVKEFIPRRARFYHKMASSRRSGPVRAVERSSNRNTVRSGECVARRVGGSSRPQTRDADASKELGGLDRRGRGRRWPR